MPPRVSLCTIVKNEEDNLPDCLGSVADLVDEIVLVDTGSTDRTHEVASRFGARVIDFPWPDSFAVARNESIRHATGEWIFHFDADDRLDEENRGRVRSLFAGLKDENLAYVMTQLCVNEGGDGSATAVDHVKLFRNHPAIRWRYRVHEQILTAIRTAGGETRWTDIVVRHIGHQDPDINHAKLERNLRLLLLDQAEHPDDSFLLFKVGWTYQLLGRFAEGLPYLRRCVASVNPLDSIVPKLYTVLVQGLRNSGSEAEALTACAEGLKHAPEATELLFEHGLMLAAGGDHAGAEARFLQLVNTRPAPGFGSVETGLRGFKARHKLGWLYRLRGRPAEAETQWRAAVAEQPRFVRAWTDLADLRLAQRDFTAARRLLEEALAALPTDIALRVLLSRTLLQEGRDWPAARQALLDVLELDPQHVEARQNLDILQQHPGPQALATKRN